MLAKITTFRSINIVIKRWLLLILLPLAIVATATQTPENNINNIAEAVENESISTSADPHDLARINRAAGAIMGVLVGDALGLGTHWYYDMDALHREHGTWVDHYVDPKPDGDHRFANVSRFRYEQGLRAGDISQTGQVYTLLLESLQEKKQLVNDDFFQRLDTLYATLSGEPFSGRYTDSLHRILLKYRARGIGWDNMHSFVPTNDTSDGALLLVPLAATISDPELFAREADQLLRVFYRDDFVRGNHIVYGLVIQALINGITVDELEDYLRPMARHPAIAPIVGGFDRFITPVNGSIARRPELVSIPEPKYVSHLFGMDCQVMHLLPAAYYLMYRFPNDFEMATLSASNGGGNNMARAALTGAIAGAINGISNIPQRLLKDLRNGDELEKLAREVASQNHQEADRE
ncbi:ADP-ribosylglycohydrolase family protein [Thalassotalea sp. G20_0]|uniref:ADP-ribosylglycohydrolase family protein n=1 Tax=Thalassotalea sp. G20_0 TaxID=2821093 RepID=UPI001ADA7E1A|nr:ADP-ribosylglycohydrolase family protein [Thalassotalea sp. G20_0]MBO9494079.1 ADP-ribosylglycohydrolase family protein [Thalassotalea sp. G20_0]